MIPFEELPIYRERAKIIEAVRNNQVTVIDSPTGSGKTTQIPIMLHEAGFAAHGMIGITQPRRIAAISVAEFIAKHMGSSVPGRVGYKIRFSDLTVPDTAVKVMTDGILLQEIKADNLLSKYSVIMVDEAHERSLNIDFILGLLKNILLKRKDFRVIISSATMNTDAFSEYYDGCPILHIDAMVYPVQINYEPQEIIPPGDQQQKMNDVDLLVRKIVTIVGDRIRKRTDGHILIFLPGEYSIKECCNALNQEQYASRIWVVPIFGRLPKEEQELVFQEPVKGKTKIVVATNIAETSITIDNITTVIDSGQAKMNYYSTKNFTSSLIETPISRASCNQRKGRAGRTAPGVCYRLYSKKDYSSRPLYTTEEIKRTDLSEVVLRMAELGIEDFTEFDFITSPGREGITSAVETLRLIGALDERDRLTGIGELMTIFPLLPRHSRMIVEAIYHYPSVIEETIIATAFLSARSPFILPQGEELEARHAHHRFSSPDGDFVTYLNIYRAYRTLVTPKEKDTFCTRSYLERQTMDELLHIVEQLSDIVSSRQIPLTSGGPYHDFVCALSAGLLQFVCTRSGRGVYRSLTAEQIYIHPGSVMFRESPDYIVAGEIVKTSRMFARSVSPIRRDWLSDIHPGLYPKLKDPTADSLESPASSRKSQKAGTVQIKKDETSKKATTVGKDQKILLFNELYPVEFHKGNRKMAVVPLEDLAKNLEAYDSGSFAGTSIARLRLRPTYKGFSFHTGDRLASIMKAIPHIPVKQGILDSPPKGNFKLPDEIGILKENLFWLFSFSKLGKKSRVLGFVALDTDGVETYWFRSIKSFHTAVDISLSSLEHLSDSIDDSMDHEAVRAINALYRRLSNIFET